MLYLKLFLAFTCSIGIALGDVVVTTNCTNANCTGGVKPGVTVGPGVQALDFSSDIMGTPGGAGASASIEVQGILTSPGSGMGTLYFEPDYTFVTPPQIVEFDIISTIGTGLNVVTGCIRPAPGSPLCATGVGSLPIELGSPFLFTLDEDQNPNVLQNVFPGENIGVDLELWAGGPDGLIPLSVDNNLMLPEPSQATLFALGGSLILVGLGVRRRLSEDLSDRANRS